MPPPPPPKVEQELHKEEKKEEIKKEDDSNKPPIVGKFSTYGGGRPSMPEAPGIGDSSGSMGGPGSESMSRMNGGEGRPRKISREESKDSLCNQLENAQLKQMITLIQDPSQRPMLVQQIRGSNPDLAQAIETNPQSVIERMEDEMRTWAEKYGLDAEETALAEKVKIYQAFAS